MAGRTRREYKEQDTRDIEQKENIVNATKRPIDYQNRITFNTNRETTNRNNEDYYEKNKATTNERIPHECGKTHTRQGKPCTLR